MHRALFGTGADYASHFRLSCEKREVPLGGVTAGSHGLGDSLAVRAPPVQTLAGMAGTGDVSGEGRARLRERRRFLKTMDARWWSGIHG